MKPSYFEVEILLDGKYYSYGFEIILSQSRFISEWLVELHADNSEKILFTRDIANGTYELRGMLARKGLKENWMSMQTIFVEMAVSCFWRS